jgi:hypothetical protein
MRRLALAFAIGTLFGAAVEHEQPRRARPHLARSPAGVPEAVEIVHPPVPPPLKAKLVVVAVDRDGEYVPVAESRDDAGLWQITTERAGERVTVYAQVAP